MNAHALAKWPWHILPLAALLLIASLPVPIAAEEPRMYRVEMVLLRHTDRNAIFSEVWKTGVVSGLDSALDFSDLTDMQAHNRFRDVSGTPFRLRSVVARLEQSPLYEVIGSYAWEQPGLPQEQAIPLRIRTGPVIGHAFRDHGLSGAAPWHVTPAMERVPRGPRDDALYEVDGTVTLSLARFLHIRTDLLYRRSTNQPVPGDFVATTEGQRLSETLVSERRRMRSGEIHYLDHPLMGVIVEVTPVGN